ncbi:8940_t:CDS:2, partial [Funneliformis caledonium]
ENSADTVFGVFKLPNKNLDSKRIFGNLPCNACIFSIFAVRFQFVPGGVLFSQTSEGVQACRKVFGHVEYLAEYFLLYFDLEKKRYGYYFDYRL